MLKGNEWTRTAPVCHEWFGDRAVWSGDFKAVSLYPGNEWELYNLANDRTESTNLAASQPEMVAKMEAIYNTWAAANGVVAWTDEMTETSGFRKSPH